MKMKYKYGKRYEYKCPHCGKVNIRYEECARIVCDKCGKEFIPSDIEQEEGINVDWVKSITVSIPYPQKYYETTYDSVPPWLKRDSITIDSAMFEGTEEVKYYTVPETTDGWSKFNMPLIKVWDNPIDDLWNGA